jgi:hypothetical protein
VSLVVGTLLEAIAVLGLSASLIAGLGVFAAVQLGRAVSRDDEQREAPVRRVG